jgi:hypothetical protein
MYQTLPMLNAWTLFRFFNSTLDLLACWAMHHSQCMNIDLLPRVEFLENIAKRSKLNSKLYLCECDVLSLNSV